MYDEHQYLENIGALSQPTLARLVYIVGTARGGTTLFHRMLGINDQILTFPGPSHFINHVWAHRNKVHNRLFIQIFRMPTFYQEETISDDILNCEYEGILGTIAGIIGTMQANEILKKILNVGNDLNGYILILDLLNLNFRKVKFNKRKKCICN